MYVAIFRASLIAEDSPAPRMSAEDAAKRAWLARQDLPAWGGHAMTEEQATPRPATDAIPTVLSAGLKAG